MIRVVYRWRVEAGQRAAFVARWRQATTAIHATTEGALGSFCLQGLDDESEVLTVALWRTEAQWRRFIGTARTGPMSALHAVATQLSATPYHQLGDETVPAWRHRP